MTLDEGVISSADHVLEAPDTWTKRMAKKWGDRIPHIQKQADGERWLIDGATFAISGRTSFSAGLGESAQAKCWADVPAALYQPAERLKMMDADGVAYSVLYPMVAGVTGEALGAIADAEFQLACVQAYNDWLIEDWASASDRFVPQCIVPLVSAEAIVAEVRRAASKGHRGVIMPATPSLVRADAPPINDPCYDDLWATCEELGVPLCLHAGASDKLRLPPYAGYSPALTRAFDATTLPQSNISAIGNVLISHILDRHPDLKVVFGGTSAGWISFMLEASEYNFDIAGLATRGYDRRPSEIFKQQCYVIGTYEDASSLRHACDSPGVQSLFWGSEFPLPISSWPESRRLLDAACAGLSSDERSKILVQNAAGLYKIDA